MKQGANILTSCNSDVNLDYKDSDFHNFQILDILKGRSSQLMNNFRKIDSNKHSRIIIMITSHGGENFIKVRGKSVILSDELNRALNEMYIKERYKEILFIVDTCEGGSLFDFVDVPNVYFVASSSRDQKSHSYSFDDKYMGPTSDKFHFKLHEILQKIHEKKSFKSAIHSIFMDIKSQREFLETDVEIINKIQREIIFEEFFGNYQTKHHKNKKYNFTISSSDTKHSELIENFKDTKNNFVEMNSIRNKIDEEVLEIKTFSENHFTTSNPDTDKTIRNQITSELINLKNIGSRALIFFTIIYTIINLLKK